MGLPFLGAEAAILLGFTEDDAADAVRAAQDRRLCCAGSRTPGRSDRDRDRRRLADRRRSDQHPGDASRIPRPGSSSATASGSSGSATATAPRRSCCMPTWSIFHSRHWKAPDRLPGPALPRRDVRRPGQRPLGPARSIRAPTPTPSSSPTRSRSWTRPAPTRAVVAGLSMGAGYAIRLAVDASASACLGLVLFGRTAPRRSRARRR